MSYLLCSVWTDNFIINISNANLWFFNTQTTSIYLISQQFTSIYHYHFTHTAPSYYLRNRPFYANANWTNYFYFDSRKESKKCELNHIYVVQKYEKGISKTIRRRYKGTSSGRTQSSENCIYGKGLSMYLEHHVLGLYAVIWFDEKWRSSEICCPSAIFEIDWLS